MVEQNNLRMNQISGHELLKLRHFLRLTILEVGKILRDRIISPEKVAVERKAAFDYVTEVDRECERLIVSRIKQRFPAHAIMSEESHSLISLGDSITWIIDPLDGTTNFIHGFPFVSVSVALVVNRVVRLGMVLDPVRQELFEAVLNDGAWLNGRPIQVRKNLPVEQSLVATGFPFREKKLMEPYLRTFEKIFMRVSGIRRTGSAALDLAYVAAGRTDGFWEVGLKPWDIAAGILLIREAGGAVSDFWGGEDVLATGHIVVGSESVYPLILQVVQEHLCPHVR